MDEQSTHYVWYRDKNDIKKTLFNTENEKTQYFYNKYIYFVHLVATLFHFIQLHKIFDFCINGIKLFDAF